MQQIIPVPSSAHVERLLPNYRTLDELAWEVRPEDPPCNRTMRNLMDRLAMPYIKVAGERRYDRNEFRTRLLAHEVNRQPRGRGRPRKAA